MKNHEEKYSEKTSQHYVSALRTVTKWFGVEIEKPILSIINERDLKQILKPVFSLPNYNEINKEHHYTFSSAVDRYQDFLHSMHNFTWIPFYSEFADILLGYKQNETPRAHARGFFCSKISASLDFARHKQTRRKLRFLVAGFAFIPAFTHGVLC